MSLMSTLGKVAMGIIVAKGVGKIMGGGSSGGNGGLLGSILGGAQGGSSGGGLSGGLGGLSDLLAGGKSQQGGGLGGLLDSLGGKSSDNPFGNLLNDALQGNEPEATSEQESQAQILLRAMISAAKADGKIDKDEQEKIVKHLGDVSDEDAEMVRNELQAPLDVQGLIDSVPPGLEQQTYLMSLLAINLDSKKEAQYLDQLAKGLNISAQMSNQIHEKVGAPQLYS